MDALSERLAARTLELVQIPSVGRDGAAVLRAIRDVMPWRPTAEGDECDVYLPELRPGAPLLLLAGHVDTVPPAGAPAPARDGDAIAGRGTADMKSGCAVMIELARDLADGSISSELDVGWLFFGREELGADESALAPMLEREAALRRAELAIVLEPTANALELGCLGNLSALVTVVGTSAHSARPWLGANAIHGAIEALRPLARVPIDDVHVDGLTYREAVSVTTIEGGIAPNVIPDRVTAHVNVRYAPTRRPADAERWLRELLSTDPPAEVDVQVEVVSNAPSGAVPHDSALVTRLRAAGDLPVRAKQAWTPVAELSHVGIDAVNFGPGDPRYAHRDDERVEVPALVRSHAVLTRFVGG